jgi:hypothetical protein
MRSWRLRPDVAGVHGEYSLDGSHWELLELLPGPGHGGVNRGAA